MTLHNTIKNPIMSAQNNAGFYTQSELEGFGFKSLGHSVLLSRLAQIYAAHKISIGNCVRIDDYAILSGAISLGSFIHISAQATITGGNGIDSSVCMGDFCSLSLGSKILSMSDDLANGVLVNSCVAGEFRNVKSSHIHLPRHNHIAAMSLVLPNSVFEIGANLGPQSLVGDTTLKAYGYYFGAPARRLKDLDSAMLHAREEAFLRAFSDYTGGGRTQARLNTLRLKSQKTRKDSHAQNLSQLTPCPAHKWHKEAA